MALRRAFSLVELIFVMVIIGILAATGTYYFRPNVLQRDVDFVLGKIKEARFKGIGYNKYEFNGSYISDPIGCIELNPTVLNSMREDREDYKLKSEIESSVEILCFDYLGRPHRDRNDSGESDNNETRLDTLLHTPLEIRLSYNGKSKTILVLPMSGFATVAACD